MSQGGPVPLQAVHLFRFYNIQHGHAALGRQPPDEVYIGTISSLPKAA